MMAVLSFFLSPIGRYVGIALIAALAYGAWDLHIRHDEAAKIQQHEQVERNNAVQKGNSARDSATRRFDRGRLRDDGFARD